MFVSESLMCNVLFDFVSLAYLRLGILPFIVMYCTIMICTRLVTIKAEWIKLQVCHHFADGSRRDVCLLDSQVLGVGLQIRNQVFAFPINGAIMFICLVFASTN